MCSEKPGTTSSWGHRVPLFTHMGSKAVGKSNEMCCKKRAPTWKPWAGSSGGVLLTVSLPWWMRCSGSFISPGPRVGPAGPALAPNPACIMWALLGQALAQGCSPLSPVSLGALLGSLSASRAANCSQPASPLSPRQGFVCFLFCFKHPLCLSGSAN